MDQPSADEERVMRELTKRFGTGFVKFSKAAPQDMEEAALCGEDSLMEEYLESGVLSREHISEAISERRMYPVCSVSA